MIGAPNNSFCIVTSLRESDDEHNPEFASQIENIIAHDCCLIVLTTDDRPLHKFTRTNFKKLVVNELNSPRDINDEMTTLEKLFLASQLLDRPSDDTNLVWIDFAHLIKFFRQRKSSQLLDRLKYYLNSKTEIVQYSSWFVGGSIAQWKQLQNLVLTLRGKMSATEILPFIRRHFTALLSEHKLNTPSSYEDFLNAILAIPSNKVHTLAKTVLYVLSYNAPAQFRALIESMRNADIHFFTRTKKVLLNNSTNPLLAAEYNDICKTNNFMQIKKNNIGISGGRQFIAEHFEKSKFDYYVFLEDDMLFSQPGVSTCRMGFPTYVADLYDRTLKIMILKELDFLKISFTEVFSDNSIQWAWYVISDKQRKNYFKHSPMLNAGAKPPKTLITSIDRHDELSVATGEIFYSNWPMWMSRKGNRKIFINNHHSNVSEEKLTASVFLQHKNMKLNAAVLLASPIEHKRTFNYSAVERKES